MNNFLVINPEDLKRIVNANDKFHAIAICVEKDSFKYSNSKYKAQQIK